MVALHGVEAGRVLHRTSLDADVLADTRLLTGATRVVSETLQMLGFRLAVVSPEGIGHRFRRESILIDVLAPEGLGERTPLTTVVGARTVRVPGGTQALKRTEWGEVAVGTTTGTIPRPNLPGAILVKARAVSVDDVPDQQRRDLAFLLSLVEDPRALAIQLTKSERGWLRKHRDLVESTAPAWHGIENAADGQLALRILASIG